MEHLILICMYIQSSICICMCMGIRVLSFSISKLKDSIFSAVYLSFFWFCFVLFCGGEYLLCSFGCMGGMGSGLTCHNACTQGHKL